MSLAVCVALCGNQTFSIIPSPSWPAGSKNGTSSAKEWSLDGAMPALSQNTLAQNCHCDPCCGMHLTCKNTPLHLTGMGRWKDPTKFQEATIAIASAESNQIGSWPFPFNWCHIVARQNRKYHHDNQDNKIRLRQQCRIEKKVEKRRGGSWVSHGPCPAWDEIRDWCKTDAAMSRRSAWIS